MTPDFSPELQAELLDDFYAECDEHLATMREQLTSLERALAANAFDPAAVETLFRSLHSFKGNAAMVALRPAEQLAHAAEDYLRRLSRHEVTLTPAGFQALVNSVQQLGKIVATHRQKQPLPAIDSILDELAALEASPPAPAPGSSAPAPAPAATSALADAGTAAANSTSPRTAPAPAPSPADPVSEALQQGLTVWRCTFTPSRELDARGLNLSSIRTRLADAGRILRATPSVLPGGGVSFEFLVIFHQPVSDSTLWAADNIRLEKLDTADGPDTARPAGVFSAPASTPSQSRPTPASTLSIAPSHIVRVDLSRLDELMRIAGELVIHRSRLEDRLNRTVGPATDDRTGLHQASQSLGRSLRELRNAISRVRMVSVAEIFTRMPFVVRDLTRETGKQVRLTLEGRQTEVDKYLVERLKEPLLHLVRNAFTHGVEPPSERVAAGKPAEATILLRATTAGQSVVLQIRDDGRGVDAGAIARRASAAGLAVPRELDPAAILDLLCTAGFSTRDQADRAAGRGVGMSVVRTTVQELGGTLHFATEPGQWTEFTLRLPLTLSIIDALVVSSGPQICALPQSSAREIVQVPEADLRTIGSAEIMPWREGALPLLRLDLAYRHERSRPPLATIIVLEGSRGLFGLAVDRVLGHREVVVRPIHDPLIQVPGVSAATELGDGRPVLILDPFALGANADATSAAASGASPQPVHGSSSSVPFTAFST